MLKNIFKTASFWRHTTWWGLIVLIAIFSWEPKPRLETPPQKDIFVDDLDKRPLFLLAEERAEAEHWLALNLYHEARGEGKKGMIASAWVVIHRVKGIRFPNNVVGVIQQKGRTARSCAFSWHCDGKSDVPKNQRWFAKTKNLAREILNGEHPDPIGGALFYYNPKKALPCWGRSHSYVKTIGNHRFYGDISWGEMKKLCRPAQSTQLAQGEP